MRWQDGHDSALAIVAADDDRGILEAVGMVVHVRALEQKYAIAASADELVPGRSVGGGIGVDAEHAAHGEGRWPGPGDGPGDGADHGTMAVQRTPRAGRHGPLSDQRWRSVQSAASGDASWRHGAPCRRRFRPGGIPCVLAGAGSRAQGFTLVQLFQFFYKHMLRKALFVELSGALAGLLHSWFERSESCQQFRNVPPGQIQIGVG